MSAGNFSVSNNLSVGGNLACSSLTTSSATIPDLNVTNLTVSGATNTGTFQTLTASTMNTSNMTATGTVTATTLYAGTKNVGTSIGTLQSDMTTAQSNVATLLTRTTNQTYTASTQTTTFTGTVAVPTLTLNGADLNTRIGATETKTTNQSFSGSTTTFTGTTALPTVTASGLLTANGGLTIPVGKVLTLSGNMTADGKTISSTELGYLDGLTGNIQSQLNLKSNIANPTFTGVTQVGTLVATSSTGSRTADVTPQGLHLQWGRTSGDGSSYIMNNQGNAGSNGAIIFQRYDVNGDFIDEPLAIADTIYVNRPTSHSANIATVGKVTCNEIQVNANANILGAVSSLYHKIDEAGMYLSNVVTNPPIIQGLSRGTGDGATYSVFNQGIMSWCSTAFVDTCNKAVNLLINHRTGDLSTKGKVVAVNVEASGTTTTNLLQVNTGANLAGDTVATNLIATNASITNATITNATLTNVTSATPFPCNIGAWVVCSNGNGIHPMFCSIKDVAIYLNRTNITPYLGVANQDYGFIVMPHFKLVCYKHPNFDTAYAKTYDNTDGLGAVYHTDNVRDLGSFKLYYKGTELTVSGISS